MVWHRSGIWLFLVFALFSGTLWSEEPAAAQDKAERVVLYSGPAGRFEVITITPALGPWALEISELVWDQLTEVLALPPAGFPSPVTLRLIPAARWQGTEPSSVQVEMAGRVTVQVPVGDTPDRNVIMQALVRGLLVKRATINVDYGYADNVPLWLELAATRWVQTHVQPALHDQWRQEAAVVRLPPMMAILSWQRDRPSPSNLDVASYGAMLWLRTLGADNGLWLEFLRRQLAGVPTANSLGAFVGQPWPGVDDLELAWQVGFYEICRQRVLPFLSIEESRGLLRDWSRVIVHDNRIDAEAVLSPTELWEHRKEPAVRAIAATRTGELELRLGSMHPFFRNAANSLGRVLFLVKKGDSKRDWLRAWEQFEVDWNDANELTRVSATILDQAQAASAR